MSAVFVHILVVCALCLLSSVAEYVKYGEDQLTMTTSKLAAQKTRTHIINAAHDS
jgi:hypothetical protein